MDAFPFDDHYPISQLYCQTLRPYMKLPRLVGGKCPDLQINRGEDHAAYKLMLFQPFRCPGKGSCNDPLLCKSCIFPSDAWEPRVKPCFAPMWRACCARTKLLASKADAKIAKSRRVPVIFDTPLCKQWYPAKSSSDMCPLSELTVMPAVACKVS